MGSAIGMVIALTTAAIAWYRSRARASNYYADQVYGMNPRTDRRYALVSVCLFLLLGASVFVRQIPGVPLLGIVVLVAIFYFSSFARGFSDDE